MAIDCRAMRFNARHEPSPSPFPDGTTSHLTKPASGQVAGYPPYLGEGVDCVAKRHQD